MAADSIPVLGNIKNLIQAVVGFDLITGKPLGLWERVGAGLSAINPLTIVKAVAGAAVLAAGVVGTTKVVKAYKNGRKVEKAFEESSDLARYAGENGNLEGHIYEGAAASRNVTKGTEEATKVSRRTDFVVSPGGTAVPVPKGAIGPGPVKTGKGFSYLEGSGGHGFDNRVTGVRIMNPTNRYPNGYAVYMNKDAQTLNPFTGQTTIGKSDPWGHIPLK